MEDEILRKVQQNLNRYAAATEETLSEGKGKFSIGIYEFSLHAAMKVTIS